MLCWVFVSVRGLSPVTASGGLSLSRPLLLRSTGSRRAGSVVVAHGPSCSAACGIFPDRGSNPCPLHWQADPQPLRHQESPFSAFNGTFFLLLKQETPCFHFALDPANYVAHPASTNYFTSPVSQFPYL